MVSTSSLVLWQLVEFHTSVPHLALYKCILPVCWVTASYLMRLVSGKSAESRRHLGVIAAAASELSLDLNLCYSTPLYTVFRSLGFKRGHQSETTSRAASYRDNLEYILWYIYPALSSETKLILLKLHTTGHTINRTDCSAAADIILWSYHDSVHMTHYLLSSEWCGCVIHILI